MRRIATALFTVLLLSGSAYPAAADWCVSLSTSSGPWTFPFPALPQPPMFVHFKGGMPKKPGGIYHLAGRIGGYNGGEPVFGTAIVAKDGSQIRVGATYFLDAEQGQFWLAMDAPFTSGTFGYGYGDYQNYGTEGANGEGTVVSCTTEPDSQ